MIKLLVLLAASSIGDRAIQFRFTRAETTFAARFTEARYESYKKNAIPDAIGRWQVADAKWRWECWSALNYVVWYANGNEDVREGNIDRLRDRLSPEDFRAGRMPTLWPVAREVRS